MKRAVILILFLGVFLISLENVSAVISCGSQTYPDGTGYCCDQGNGANGVWFRGDYYNSCPSTAGNYRYVSNSGSDSANGLTPATAWRTMEKFTNNLFSGQTGIIIGGTYNEQTRDTGGSYKLCENLGVTLQPNSGTIVKGHPDYSRPIINASGFNNPLSVKCTEEGHCHHRPACIGDSTTLDYLEITDSYAGIRAYGSNTVFQGLLIHDTYGRTGENSDGIFFGYGGGIGTATNVMIRGNEFHHIYNEPEDGVWNPYLSYPGVTIYRSFNVTVENNYFHDLEMGVHFKNMVARSVIRKNLFRDVAWSIMHFCSSFTPSYSDEISGRYAGDSDIYENIVYGTGGGAIPADLGIYILPSGTGDCDTVPAQLRNLRTFNNVFYNSKAGVFITNFGTINHHNLSVLNNLMINQGFASERENYVMKDPGLLPGFNSNYNLLFDYPAFGDGSEVVWWAQTAYYNLAQYQSVSGWDTNSKQVDPMFLSTNPSSPDFLRPAPGSPAIDNGTIVPGYHCNVSASIDPSQTGCKLWYGLAPDIGAYEYNSLAGAPVCNAVSPNRCWYVDNTRACSDSGSGNFTNPLCTIGAGNGRMAAGDTLSVLAGEYRETLWAKAGLSPTQRTVYDGNNNSRLNGAKIVSGWTQCLSGCASTNVYYASLTFTETFGSMSGGVFEDGRRMDWEHPAGSDCGAAACEAKTLTDLNSPGEVYYDQGLQRLYVWTFESNNPSGHLIEAANRPNAWGANNIVIKNFNMVHGYWGGVRWDSASYIDVLNNNISKVTQAYFNNPACVWSNYLGDHIYVAGNRCEDSQVTSVGPPYSTYASPYGCSADCFHNSILENNFNINTGVWTFKNGGDNITVRNNTMINSVGNGMGLGGIVNNVKYYDNIIFNPSYDGIAASDGSGGAPNTNVQIIGNTIYNPGHAGIGLATGNSGILIKNNIMKNTGVQEIIIEGSTAGSTTSNYNLFHRSSGGLSFNAGGTNYNGLINWRSGTGFDINSIEGDPQFLSTTYGNSDFMKISSTSPAKDNGEFIPGYHCSLADDAGGSSLTGCRHWYGSKPDMGALEYNPGLPSITCIQVDVNDDLKINILDLALTVFNQGKSGAGYNHLDIDADGIVDGGDVGEVRGRFGQSC
jgi:hypothetical protein